jgi:GNAT superfamily N-acetyltransferase
MRDWRSLPQSATNNRLRSSDGPRSLRVVLSIRRLDPHDDAEFAAFHAVYAAANDFERPNSDTWTLAESVVTFRRVSPTAEHYGLIADEGGDVVGVAAVELPLTDNLDLAEVGVYVAPTMRRRGIGSALARQIAVDLVQRSRTSWMAQVPGRRCDQPADTVTPGEAFAARQGMNLRQREVQRRLAMPAPGDRLDALAAEAAPKHQAYRLVRWVDECPNVYVDAYCALKTAMVDQMPTGELDMEAERWDAERLREYETHLLAQSRTRHVYAAVAPDGSIAGHTELVVPAHDPGVIYQWDTLVLPKHRGHRLGLALKVANLAWTQTEHPDRTSVRTWNAESNDAMIAVNDAMGFEPVEYEGSWQGPIPT